MSLPPRCGAGAVLHFWLVGVDLSIGSGASGSWRRDGRQLCQASQILDGGGQQELVLRA